MGKIYCNECGAELDDAINFCPSCGKAIGDNSPKIENKLKTNRNFLIIGILGILAILLLVGIVFMGQGSDGSIYTINGLDFTIPNAYDKYDPSSQTVHGLYSENYEFSTSKGYNYDDITITVTDIGNNDVSDLENNHRNDWVWNEEEIGGKTGFGKISGSTQYGFVYYENNKQVVIEVPMTPSVVDMSQKELIAYIDEHDGADLTEMIATIEGIEGKLAGIDSTVVAYVTAAIDALKIGDYAKAADLTALAGRVEALEAKPFDTYATKTEVSNVDAKFANYTTTETLTTQLAAKADADKVVANDTFETFKTENTTAIGTAKSEAIAAAAKAVEDAGYAVASDVAETYATKTALTEAVEGIENDLLAYAKTADVEAELAKKINKATISHSTDEKAEGATVTGTQLDIVVDAFTKAETRQYVADTIKTMTGGESAADVKLLLENHVAAYTEKVGQIDAKDAAQDTAIATAQAQADKGVADAAEVAVGLVTANANIGNNTREIETVKGTITTVNETLSGKITALENKDVEIAGLVSGLDTAVKGNATTIGEHTAAITALQAKDTELAGLINGVDAKFANYYDKDVVDAKVIASGEVVRGTADAIAITGTKITVTVNSYTKDEVDSLLTNFNRTELANGIEANTTALAVLVGTVEGDDKKSVRNIAKEEVAAIVGAAPEALDTLEEIATWIGTDTTGAAAMASDITSLKAKVDTGDKTVSEYVDDAIAAIPDLVVATAETLGGVKSSTAENKVTVSTDGTMEVNSVNANKLVQTEGDILVLDGGRALN